MSRLARRRAGGQRGGRGRSAPGHRRDRGHRGPGLVGSLLVGVSTAKGLAMGWGRPLVGVNHLEAHLFGEQPRVPRTEGAGRGAPRLGGHTLLVLLEELGRYRVLGETLDDAAGEAYDKVARDLGLAYPGGPAIDRVAHDGDPEAFYFPRVLRDQGYDFSFSGLKTAVVRTVEARPEAKTEDVAASFQEAVVDVLILKARRAVAEDLGPRSLPGGRGGRQLAPAQPRRAGVRRGRRQGLRPEPGHVHRQCRHGGGGRVLAPVPSGALRGGYRVLGPRRGPDRMGARGGSRALPGRSWLLVPVTGRGRSSGPRAPVADPSSRHYLGTRKV